MKEYDYAVEYSKIFINLATILLGLTLTFFSSIVESEENAHYILLLMLVSWVLWISSIFMGAQSISIIVTLAAGSNDNSPDDDEPDGSGRSQGDVFDSDLAKKLRWQRWLFISGFAVTVLAVLVSSFLSW